MLATLFVLAAVWHELLDGRLSQKLVGYHCYLNVRWNNPPAEAIV